MSSNNTPKRWRISRRGFLIGAGSTGAVLALGWLVGLPRILLRFRMLLKAPKKPLAVVHPRLHQRSGL